MGVGVGGGGSVGDGVGEGRVGDGVGEAGGKVAVGCGVLDGGGGVGVASADALRLQASALSTSRPMPARIESCDCFILTSSLCVNGIIYSFLVYNIL